MAEEQTGVPQRVFNLADLFEIVVDAVPDRPALLAGDVRLTSARALAQGV